MTTAIVPRSVLGRLDAATSEDPARRAADRHRRIALATVAGAVSRASAALALVVALPLAARHLDAQELGIWTLLVTAVTLLGFADLGLTNGLLNVLADAVGREDRPAARRAVAGALAGLVAVAIAGALAVALVLPHADWAGLLHVAPTRVPQLHTAIAVFLLLVLVGIPTGIGQKIHLAYQQGWAASLTTGLASLAALGGVVIAAVRDAGLVGFVVAMLAPSVVAGALETAWVLGRSHPDLRPRLADVDPIVLRRLLRAGLLFFVLALAGATAYQSDTLVIAHVLGPAEVTRYGVSLRVFSLAPIALTALLMPLWPAYGEALARRDHEWVRTTLRRSLLVAVGASGAASLVLLAVARPILSAWAGDVPAPPTSLLLGLAVWAVVSSSSMALAMYFNGANVVRLQVVLAVLMAGSNLALSIVLARRIGVAGPVWASVITQTVIVLLPELCIVRPLVRRGPMAEVVST